MPVSQFNKTLTVSTSSEPRSSSPLGSQIPEGAPVIEVGGPLRLGAPEDYVHPIMVQFLVVQVPEHDDAEGSDQTEETDRDALKSVRVRGVGEEVLVNGDPDPNDPRWSGTVPLGDLKVGPEAEEAKMETRGVAVALLERKEQFAFDTITWCDRVELEGNTPEQGSSGR
jgi:hypothetical protein